MKILDIEGLQALWNKIKERLAEANAPTMGKLPAFAGELTGTPFVNEGKPVALGMTSVMFYKSRDRFILRFRLLGSSSISYYSQWDGMEAYGTPGTGGVAPDASIVYLRAGSPVRWNGAAFVAADAGLMKYTDKQKLDALPESAATAEKDGWMSKEDKAKLDGMGEAWQISPKQLAANDDLDSLTQSGWYWFAASSRPSGAPPSGADGFANSDGVCHLRVLAAQDGNGKTYGHQKLWWDNTQYGSKIWMRRTVGDGTWTSWATSY